MQFELNHFFIILIITKYIVESIEFEIKKNYFQLILL
jgi:hypothetical protein